VATLKICGITRFADLKLALRLGADYIGAIVQIPRSPRSLDEARATALLMAAAGRGVMVTESESITQLEGFARRCPLAAIQLHGGQSEDHLRRLRQGALGATEVWAVLSMSADREQAGREIDSLIQRAQAFADAGASRLVLDAKVRGVSGGTGVPVNWELARQVIERAPVPVLLAGGITAHNAIAALGATGARGLDVSSGVERSPGVKSPAALRSLVLAVRSRGAAST